MYLPPACPCWLFDCGLRQSVREFQADEIRNHLRHRLVKRRRMGECQVRSGQISVLFTAKSAQIAIKSALSASSMARLPRKKLKAWRLRLGSLAALQCAEARNLFFVQTL